MSRIIDEEKFFPARELSSLFWCLIKCGSRGRPVHSGRKKAREAKNITFLRYFSLSNGCSRESTLETAGSGPPHGHQPYVKGGMTGRPRPPTWTVNRSIGSEHLEHLEKSTSKKHTPNEEKLLKGGITLLKTRKRWVSLLVAVVMVAGLLIPFVGTASALATYSITSVANISAGTGVPQAIGAGETTFDVPTWDSISTRTGPSSPVCLRARLVLPTPIPLCGWHTLRAA